MQQCNININQKFHEVHLKGQKSQHIFLCSLLGLYMTPTHISDVIFMSQTPMDWTYAHHTSDMKIYVLEMPICKQSAHVLHV